MPCVCFTKSFMQADDLEYDTVRSRVKSYQTFTSALLDTLALYENPKAAFLSPHCLSTLNLGIVFTSQCLIWSLQWHVYANLLILVFALAIVRKRWPHSEQEKWRKKVHWLQSSWKNMTCKSMSSQSIIFFFSPTDISYVAVHIFRKEKNQ